MLKTELVVECFADEIRLAHAASSIDGAKLRLLFFKKAKEFSLFFFASYYHNSVLLVSAANITKILLYAAETSFFLQFPLKIIQKYRYFQRKLYFNQVPNKKNATLFG